MYVFLYKKLWWISKFAKFLMGFPNKETTRKWDQKTSRLWAVANESMRNYRIFNLLEFSNLLRSFIFIQSSYQAPSLVEW